MRYLLRIGRIDNEVVEIMAEEALCSHYGWTPDYVRNMDNYDFNVYVAILSGKASSRKSGDTPRQVKRAMR